jgi:hypothetical protein
MPKNISPTLTDLDSISTDISNQLVPKEPCHKCGKTRWVIDDDPYTWVCLNCNNLIMLNYGKLIQQIDIIYSNPVRRNDYVKSIKSGTIKLKKKDDIKQIKFDKYLKDIREGKNNAR